MKKLIPIITLLATLFALTGCEEEASKTTHATNINSTEKAVKEPPKKGIDRTHNLTVQGQTLTLTSSYQVDERNLNNYVFTTPSVIDESLRLQADADARFKVRVTNLYSDVTVSSNYSRYNGLRQDSMNLDLSHAPNGGYDITTTESYDQPFQVESVNQNEQFIHGWNGYISSDYSYLTESNIRDHSDGAVLRTVWTLAIENTETHQLFSKSLSDTIFMPSHEDKK
jgi:lipoprotein